MAKKRKAKSTSMTRSFTDGDTTVKVTVKDKNNMTASRKTATRKTTKKTTSRRRKKRDSGDTIAFLFN